jgi:uncharacterized membrane-anchored protein YitT (DUF2179 family)
MSSLKERMNDNAVFRNVVKYLVIIIGSAVFAVGFQFFMYPNNIVSGGAVGVAMIINKLFNVPVGVMTIIINIPLFIIAWRNFGTDFLIGSLVGMALSSVFMDTLAVLNISLTDDPMLACIIGGAIKGIGLGMVYYVGATTGGVDIVAKLLRMKNPHINFGTLLMLLDAAIIVAYAIILNKYESAMYSVIAMFVVSKVIDLVLYGTDISSVCYIISERSDEIAHEIISGHMHRGVTILDGKGAYSGKDKQVIMCVIKRQQISEIRRIIRNIDDNAFFIVSDAKNVFGNGFESIHDNN